ncbi:MAG: DUF6588 family protein [Bacteroidota bacterium]
MKSIFRFAIAIICVLTFASGIVIAQDLQQQISKLGRDAAIGYISPILSGWGNDLNSGSYYSADLHDVLGFDIGVKLAMSHTTDADKSYTLNLPSTVNINKSLLNYTQSTGVSLYEKIGTNYVPYTSNEVQVKSGNAYATSITAPTAIGDKNDVVVKGKSGTTVYSVNGNPLYAGAGGVYNQLPNFDLSNNTLFTLPGGYNLGSLGVPLPMPQLNLGLPFGLEFMLRYFPTTSYQNYGKFSYMGFGLRYDIDQWIPLCPVDLAVHFMTQKLTFKSSSDQDIFTGKATAYGIEVSKKLFILTLYGGFQMESSTLTVADYTYSGDDPTLQGLTVNGFEIKGSDKSRFTVGARLLLLFINVHADYSFATTPVLTLGAGITIR